MVLTTKNGQVLVELLIAIALASILLPALLTGFVASREGKAQSGQRLEAAALLREAQEAIRSIREKGFSNISANGTFYPNVTPANDWELASGSQAIDGFTRQIQVSDSERDVNGNIVESGGTVDRSTKKVVSSVSWTTPGAFSLTNTSYFQRYLSNAAFSHTTQAEFAAGVHSNTTAADVPGSIVLTQSSTGSGDYGNKFRVTATSGIGSMSRSNAAKSSMRFTAQNSKSVSAVRVYVHSKSGTAPTYRFGIQTNNPSGNIPSGTWVGGQGTLSNPAAGWRPATLSSVASLTAGQIYHFVVEYASGTQSGNISLRRSTPQNLLYPLTQAADTQSNTLYYSGGTWTAQGYQPIYELDFFSDATYEGNPYEASTEIQIFGNSWYGEKFTISGSSKTVQSISFCVRKNGTPASNLTVELRNGLNTTIYSGTLLTVAGAPTSYTCPASWQTHTFSPSPIVLNPDTYRIFLRTTGGTSTNSYRLYRLNAPTTGANYHSITYDDTNSVYTNATSPGITWTDSNQYDITSFFIVQGTSQYSTSGDFTSHASGSFDTGVTDAAYNNITWTAATPAGTSLGLQIATSNTNPPTTFVGPDGTPATQYTISPATITPFNSAGGRYLRYKAIFASNGLATAQLDDVSINYSP